MKGLGFRTTKAVGLWVGITQDPESSQTCLGFTVEGWGLKESPKECGGSCQVAVAAT